MPTRGSARVRDTWLLVAKISNCSVELHECHFLFRFDVTQLSAFGDVGLDGWKTKEEVTITP